MRCQLVEQPVADLLGSLDRGINQPVGVVGEAKDSGVREVGLQEISEQVSPPRVGCACQFCRSMCPCVLRMSTKAVNCNDPGKLLAAAFARAARSISLEGGGFRIGDDLKPIRAGLFATATDLGDDGKQHNRGQ